MSEGRYDIVYHSEGVDVQPHFCREWDGGHGCYGNNPSHGLTLEEAADEIATWHEQQAREWRARTHHSYEYYINQEAAEE